MSVVQDKRKFGTEPSTGGAADHRRLITASRIGEANRARVLQVLHTEGPASRAQLARALNVNRATIASILQPLIDDGSLVEGDPVPAPVTGGKPARPLWFSHDGPLLGGVRISPDGVSVALMGIDGTIRVRAERGYDRDASGGTIMEALEQAADECFVDRKIIGIGVGSAGMVNSTTGTIISMHLTPGLNGLHVGDRLQGRYGVPVLVDHHPRVQALGDRWFGLGRHLQDFASVYTGEALGFGIVYQGAIVRGKDGAGGESGHTTVQLDGAQCRCGRQGCWETVATLGWLRQAAAELNLPEAERVDSAGLVRMSTEGNAAATGLLDLYARNLAVGMANNEQVLGSGTYIMHGDVCGGGEQMRTSIQAWMDKLTLDRGQPPTVLFADVQDPMTLLGGGGLVLASTFATTA
jgi:predicted NBD/HSP70 family sugar kinase